MATDTTRALQRPDDNAQLISKVNLTVDIYFPLTAFDFTSNVISDI